jgi:hypothetical protein
LLFTHPLYPQNSRRKSHARLLSFFASGPRNSAGTQAVKLFHLPPADHVHAVDRDQREDQQDQAAEGPAAHLGFEEG